jgi:hypothetical protein
MIWESGVHKRERAKGRNGMDGVLRIGRDTSNFVDFWEHSIQI